MLRNPPGRKDLRKAQLLGPGSPLGLKFSCYVPDSELQELAGHTLFRVCYVIIAVRKDAHAHETPGCSRSEVACRESISTGICLVDNGEGERVQGSEERVSAGGALVARIFMQKKTRKELYGLPGGAIGNLVPVESAKCITAVLPFSWVVAWRIHHLEACPQCWQYHGWRAKGIMDVDLKLVSAR